MTDNTSIIPHIKKQLKHDAFKKFVFKTALVLGGTYFLAGHHDFLFNLDSLNHGTLFTILKNGILASIFSNVVCDGFIFSKEKKYTKIAKIANEYIHFNDDHLLTNFNTWAEKAENVESISKHVLLGLYFARHGYMENRVVSDIEREYFAIKPEQFYFLPALFKLAEKSPTFSTIFEQIYEKDFKDERLLGYALFHAPVSILAPMVKGLKGKIEINDEDYIHQENNHFLNPNSSLAKDKLRFLFEEKNYIQLPTKLRTYLVEHAEPKLLEEYKEKLYSYEKKIETLMPNEKSILQEQAIEKAKKELHEKDLIQEAPISFSENQIEQILIKNKHNLNQEVIDNIEDILTKSQVIYPNLEKLEVQKQVDFKHFMDVALPKYLDVFSHSVNEDNKKEFIVTLNLFHNYLNSCLTDIEKTNDDNFTVQDTYLKSKLESYQENTQKLNLKM